jgi:sterol 24-C-methyltransferase
VLDAGCGQGDVAIRLATRYGLEVDGVDLLDANLRHAGDRAARLGMSDSLRFHRLDYADLAFPDRSFDGDYTIETLVHAFDHQRALRELRRVLKPGGKLAGPAAAGPGRAAELHRRGRGLPAPGRLALQRRHRPPPHDRLTA